MPALFEYYNSQEELVFADDKLEVINRKFSGHEKICYQILYMQVYVPNSCDEQIKLFHQLNDVSNSSLKVMRDELKARYMLLKQGVNVNLLPEISDFIKEKCNLDFSVVAFPPIQTSQNKTTRSSLPSILDYSALDSFIKSEFKEDRSSEAYLEHQLTVNTDPKEAKRLLDGVNRRGLPGVVTTIMLYYSTVDRKDLAAAPVWLNLLRYEDIEELQSLVKKTYSLDLFQNDNVRSAYMERFGDASSLILSIPGENDQAEAIYRSRVSFLKSIGMTNYSLELKQILKVQIAKQKYDMDLFIEYLKKRVSEDFPITIPCDTKKTNVISLSNFEIDFFRHIFPEISPDRFIVYVKAEEVNALYEEMRLLRGEDFTPCVLSPFKVDSLRQSIRCCVVDENTKFYSVGDEVKVKVELKNVESVEVRLFEINTMSYFLKNSDDISVKLDLDGLIPSISTSYTYHFSAMVSHIEEFTFPTVNHRGVYVVDFIASGLSSRFLIHYGSLYVLKRSSLSGYALTVIDEKGEQIESNMKVLLENREYFLNKSHEIIIPYLPESESSSKNLLLCQEVEAGWSYVQQYALQMEGESFDLNICGDIDNEAIVKGNDTCRVILRITALLNDCIFPLSLLKNVAITLTCQTTNNVKTETTIHPTLEDNKDFSYVFRVMETVETVTASISADVVTSSGTIRTLYNSCVPFDVSPIAPLNRTNDAASLTRSMRLFRRMHNNQLEYVLQVYDPAGEAISHIPLTVHVQHMFCRCSYQQNLETDDMGQIVLGSLTGVTSVRVEEQSFFLYRDEYDITNSFVSAETEEIQAVLPAMTSDLSKCMLICTSAVNEYKSVEGCLKVESGYMIVSGLSSGLYHLYITADDLICHTVRINIRRSSSNVKVCQSYVVFGRWARQIREFPLSLQCSCNDNKLQISLQGGSGGGRVHVLCKSFLDSMMIGSQLKSGNQSVNYFITDLDAVSCVSANSRALPEEYAYILERKKHDRDLPGNMLPHPSLVLNPVEMSETITQNIEPRNGSDYDCFSPSYCPKFSSDRCYCGGSSDFIAETAEKTQREAISAIRHTSELLVDISLDEEGNGEIDLPRFGQFGVEVVVVAVDKNSSIEKHLYLPEENEQCSTEKGVNTLLRELVLEHVLDGDKHFLEKKKISSVNVDQPLILSNMTEMETLSSLSDVYLLLKTLSSSDMLQKFSFLLTWLSLSTSDKLSLYNSYNCSELNVFIYFRDRSFFDANIRKYLDSKIELSFLDMYLLNRDLTSFLNPSLFSRLNAFERALLSGRIAGDRGKGICEGMRSTASFTHMSSVGFSHIFNTALKMKSMGDVSPSHVKENGIECESDTVEERMPVPEMMCMAAAPAGFAAMPGPQAFMRRRMCGGPMMRSAKMVQKVDDDDREQYISRKKSDQLYEKLEKTKEYVEGYYYNSKSMYSNTSIVPISPFWADYAEYLHGDKQIPFMSTSFIHCTHSLSEILFCLAVIGVSFGEEPFVITKQSESTGYTFKSQGPIFVFHKVLEETNTTVKNDSVVVLQKYIDENNKYNYVNGTKVDRYMDNNEFLPQQAYTCSVIVSNMLSEPQSISLLYQIPQGSFPLSSSFMLHTESIDVKPYGTSTFSYSFYFPVVGNFAHYPAQLFSESKSTIVAFAASPFTPIHVASYLCTVDVTSWRDVAASADSDTLFTFIRSHDLVNLDWTLIRWRLVDKAFFLLLIAELRRLGFYDRSIWSFGVYHKDVESTRDFLSDAFTSFVGLAFESPILTLQPAVEDLFRIREYKPYITSRCFRLGRDMKIANDKLETQYDKLLKMLCQRRVTTDDYALLTYYLLLQDRVVDAMNLFKTRLCEQKDGVLCRREDCSFEVQFDYMTSYFDCFSQNLSTARRLCEHYKEYPVLYWREMFANIAELVKEVDGSLDDLKIDDTMDLDGKDETNLPANVIRVKRTHAQMDSSLDLTLTDHIVMIKYGNMSSVSIGLYEMNVELMFSNNPFIHDSNTDSLFVRPNFAETVSLPSLAEGQMFGTFQYELPEKYRQKNLLVEVCGKGLRETCFSFNSRLVVVLSAKSGQLRVFDKDTRKAISCCYVKAYAKTDDGVKFLKDGFTDIRGYFDYFAVSSNLIDKTTNIAIFIDKEGCGSCVREVLPPSSVI